MSKNRRNTRAVRPQGSVTNAVGTVSPVNTTPPLTTEPAVDVDVAAKFMRENPKGSFPEDTADDVVQTLATPDPTADAVVANHEGSATDPVAAIPEVTGGEAVVDAAPAAPATDAAGIPTPTGGEVPPEVVPDIPGGPHAAEVPAAPAAAVEPAVDRYAGHTKIDLMEGSEPWTREQIIAGLQERVPLQEQAAEADHFRQFFGSDFKRFSETIAPALQVFQRDQSKAQMAQAIVDADPATLDYLKQSLEYFNSPEARELRGVQPGTPTAATTPQAHDPRMEKYERTIQHLQKVAIGQRVQNEWSQVEAKYPFLKHDAKARQALTLAASELFTSDERAGKDPLECRGLLDAMNNQSVFLEMAAIASSKLGTSAPARETPQVVPAQDLGPKPGVGQQALLGSSGPTPSGVRSAGPPTVYRGNSEDAVKAFTNDYPRQ